MIPADVPPPAWRPEVYFQARVTDAQAAETLTGIRRSRFNIHGLQGTDRYLIQFFYKIGFHQTNDDRLLFHDVSWSHETPGGTLTLGQFRPAFGRQRLTGDQQILFADRAVPSDMFIPAGGFSHSFARDMGIQWEPKLPNGWIAFGGLFRGDGTMHQMGIGKGSPGVALRALKQFGDRDRLWETGFASTVRDSESRDFSRAFPGLKNFRGRDTRLGFEVAARHGAWRGGAEWLQAFFDGSGASPNRRADGGYIEVARTLKPGLEAVAMVQTFDPDTSTVAKNDTSALTVGMNFTPKGTRNRWQVDYVVRRERVTESRNDMLQIQYQHFLTK